MVASFEMKKQVSWIAGGGWKLHFQWGSYNYADGSSDMGYRFIWERPNHTLQARPALIPSAAVLFSLIQQAAEKHWFVTVESTSTQG
jgi:hypothetical protein